MTRVGRRLIEDFLLPALNNRRYGDLLKWIDPEKCYFSIQWSHKNAAKWTLQDTIVFQDWDKLKGHYHPEIKGYYMQAKQRFRAALYKLNTVKKLPCDDKHVKKYQLILDDSKKTSIQYKPRLKKIAPKLKESQRSIPTSVICKNSAYVAKQQSHFCEEPPSPTHSYKSEISESAEDLVMSIDSDEEQQQQKKLFHEEVSRPKIPWHTPVEQQTKSAPPTENNCTIGDSPLANGVQRVPHVPIQPVPVYSKCTQKALQRRFESPHVLLVPIYRSAASENYSRDKTEKYSFAYSHQTKTSDGALNLTVKPKPITNR